MSKNISIVDDSEDLRTLFSLLFERRLGACCKSFGSFEEFIEDEDECLSSDVVILDVNLGTGQKTGLDINDWLLEKKFKGRVFFLTGHAGSPPLIQHARSTGAEVLEKPLKPEAIVNIIGKSLELH